MLLSYQHPELLLTEDFTMCAQLSSCVLEASYVKEFMAFLGFDFQKDGAHDKDPFVVFPHWDPDGTLAMTSQVLQAICGKVKLGLFFSWDGVHTSLNLEQEKRCVRYYPCKGYDYHYPLSQQCHTKNINVMSNLNVICSCWFDHCDSSSRYSKCVFERRLHLSEDNKHLEEKHHGETQRICKFVWFVLCML